MQVEGRGEHAIAKRQMSGFTGMMSVRVKAGEVFSRQRITETTKAITDRLGNDGYAFAKKNRGCGART